MEPVEVAGKPTDALLKDAFRRAWPEVKRLVP
jgi:hypothetical protein